MKKAVLKGAALGALIITGSLAASQAALADEYEVTIRSLTHGQPIAPSLFVTHDEEFSLFEVGPVPEAGAPGREQYLGLAQAAETGNPGRLAAAVNGAVGVEDFRVLLFPPAGPDAPPVLPPGESNSLEERGLDPIQGAPGEYFSAVAMLGGTNDAFYGVRNVKLPKKRSITVRAGAYDAGSEENDELLEHTPPGGNSDDIVDDVIDPNATAENGEDFIHVHAGIQGVPDRRGGWDADYLNPTVLDWRNPVVEITITHVEGGE
jgi:hypothetical protein